MAANKLFQEALEAIKSGEQAQARSLLYRLVKMDGSNADYWLYLSSVLENPKEIQFCINKALEIDPQNATAKRGLALQGFTPKDHSVTPIKPVRKRKYQTPEIFSGSSPNGNSKKRISLSKGQIVGLSIITIIGFSLIYFGIMGNPFFKSPAAYILPSGEDLRPLPDTKTPTATATATLISSTQMGTPDPVTLTPLSVPLDITYTATPRLVDTPHPESDAYNEGLLAFDQGNYELAIEKFSTHISDFQRDADVEFYLGLAYYQLGEFEEADAAFVRSTEINPEFGLAYLWEAITKLAYLENPSIGNLLMLAVKNAPDYVGSYLERGNYFLRHLSMDHALGDLESALELAPDNAEVHLFAANYYYTNDLFEEALLSAKTAFELDVKNPNIYKILGQAYFKNDFYTDAIPPLQRYLIIEPENAEAWLLLGRAQLMAGYQNAALASFDQVETLTNKLFAVNLYKGIAYIEVGNIEKAMPQLDLAILNYPKSFEAILYHGVGLMESGNAWEGYLEINSSSGYALTDEQLAFLYYWRGFSLEKLRKSDLAKPDWESLLALDFRYLRAGWAETASKALLGNFFTATSTITPTPTEVAPTPTTVEITITPTP